VRRLAEALGIQPRQLASPDELAEAEKAKGDGSLSSRRLPYGKLVLAACRVSAYGSGA